MAKRLMTVDDVIKMLSREVEKAGSQRALARQMGVSVQFISRVLAGKAPPGSRTLDWLGLEEDGMRYVRKQRPLSPDEQQATQRALRRSAKKVK